MPRKKAPATAEEGEHPLVQGLRWILENRKQPGGRAWSMRALSLAAGLTPGHVEQILNKRQSADVELDTAQLLARAGQVSVQWLQTGQGPRDAAGADAANDHPSPAPPPVSGTVTRIAYDQVQSIVNTAMVPGRHEFVDGLLVADALRLGAALDAGDDPVRFARRLLDTAAKNRGRKPAIEARDLVSLTLARLSNENERLEQQMREVEDAADDWARANGLPTGEAPTHPLLLEAAEAATRPGPKGRRQ